MANEELQEIRLKTDFYRDGFTKVILALILVIAAIALLILMSIYLYSTKPKPVYFSTDNEWRVLVPVPEDKPYLKSSDLLQWVSEALPVSFTYDFVNYQTELPKVTQYYTPGGWQKLLDQLNIYANSNTMQTQKLFISASAAGAPFVLNQGVLSGKYAWWVQMPIMVYYNSANGGYSQALTVQVLVTRIPTLDSYYGVAIDNIIITKGQGSQVRPNV